jgi:hypothetical protein
VFSSKSNLNLVLEFLDTDLEAVIKDRELVFQASDIKSWMLMTMQGLDFCHQNWVLHRVCDLYLISSGFLAHASLEPDRARVTDVFLFGVNSFILLPLY